MIKIGHRGAMGYAPENTLISFKKALDLRVDMIELDVYVCKTGELVVIQDDKVDRTTNGKGWVTEMTFEELRSLDAGQGEKIPTLEEVFNLADEKTKINVELKGPETAKPVLSLIDNYVSSKRFSYDDFLISSFDHHELVKAKKINPDIKIGALITGVPIDYAKFGQDLGAYSVNLCREFINQEFVDDAHKKGLKVLVWTVNDHDEIKRMKDLGVDGIFSNFPDRL